MVSVLAPTLCNLYTNDLPVTGHQKFIYIDDICLGKQACTFAERDKQTRHAWKTMPPLTQTSVSKTVCSVLHLHNASSGHELKVTLNGQSASPSDTSHIQFTLESC